jgi:metallophosphoesterase superfamily enzyme
LVLPALGPLAFGTDLIRVGTGSPHLRGLDRRRWRIFAATGTGMLDFGTVEDIRAAMGPDG